MSLLTPRSIQPKFLTTSFNHLISLHHANPVSSVNPFSEHSNILWYCLLFEKPSIDLVSPLGYVLFPFHRPSLLIKDCLQILSYFFLPNLSLSHSNKSLLNGATKKSTENVPPRLTNNPIWSNQCHLFIPHLSYFSTVLRLTFTSSLKPSFF